MHDKELEEGTALLPRFDLNGLISAIVTDEKTGEVLMLAHMNEEALRRTIETREGWFWSRSRKSLWKKGESSGNVLQVSAMKIDCDQDAVLLNVRVSGDGKTCHTGRRTCFYRSIPLGSEKTALHFDE
ncbi:MAG TPA: phosphoribosyl-AMP cyclohydrolase [Xanthobacteraceae bacterium]|nr:phosphoribosyl-AMP cyclohydrolase [Xanthobacteraceae bacterium]